MTSLNCKIVKVGDERRTKNPGKDGKTHRYRWVEVTELSLGTKYSVCVYNNGLEWNLNAGDEVTLSVNEIKTMPGKYSGGLDKVAPIVKEEPTPEIEEKTNGKDGVPQSVWAAKEKRDFRGRAIMYALDTVNHEHPEPKGQEDTRASLVIKVAEQYEEWIYREDEKEPF